MSPPRASAVRHAVGVLVVAATALALVGGCGDDEGGRGGGGGDDLASSSLSAQARRGLEVARDKGCTSCHSDDGTSGTGPSWKGIWGDAADLDGGGTVTVDRAYVTRSIRDPSADVVDGFAPVMPQLDLSDDEIDAVVAYLRALG